MAAIELEGFFKSFLFSTMTMEAENVGNSLQFLEYL
jgi:hypothetical protein